ncbi:hypothetical protein AB0M46_20840 [Dactylosporangium sp. NPDC051485]|uniref:Rv0361 family membrane protein n=1 Tax=Dactylosporangium sp. NPDC051485 TaxID=3154846 RepID=UPI00342B5BEB
MTQPPQYPGQPEYQGQPGQPGQGWPPAQPSMPPIPDPYTAPVQPTSGQPFPGQPFPNQPYPGQPDYGQPTGQLPPTGAFGQPTGPFPAPTGQFPTGPVPQPGMAPPFSGPPAPVSGMPVSGYPMYPPQPPVKKKRGLMITLIVLGVVLVLCGGGGAAAWFVVQNNQGTGASTPVEAVNGFLTAVYKNNDADAALKYVCSSSRDKDKLNARVNDIRKFNGALSSPTYTWPAPTVEKQDKDQATLVVDVKVTTSDEKVAEMKYKYIATQRKGWWVCEITAA